MALTDQLNALHTRATVQALKTEYEQACKRFAGDDAALWAIREATFYAKERLTEKAA